MNAYVLTHQIQNLGIKQQAQSEMKNTNSNCTFNRLVKIIFPMDHFLAQIISDRELI